MAKSQRPFNPAALDRLVNPSIKALVGVGAVVWRYTILIPIEETAVGGEARQIATDKDLVKLRKTLTSHFAGLTILPTAVGYGLRDGQLELNKHDPLVVYASATAPSDEYFRRLRKELEEALVQETILVERQEVWLH